MTLNADGGLVACGDDAGVITIWNGRDRTARAKWPSMGGRVETATLSADGRTLLTVQEQRGLRIWDAATGQERPKPSTLKKTI